MMESGGEGHSGNGGRSGGGNGGLLCNSCELGVPHQWPSPFFPPHLHGRRGDSHHLNCLKLGKRQFFEEGRVSEPSDALGGMKRERLALAPRFSSSSPAAATALSPLSPATATVAPRCQVEGCDVALADAKDYHRRHKVCETHSKAPKVLLLGREQRFCQQCSRFHVISEFDDSKRSCRRRLAGHNERRRKSSAESVVRTPSPIDGPAAGSRVVPYLAPPSSSATSRALPLLSSKPSFSSPWTPPDLSSQSSAALRELIAENRAAVLAGQLLADRGGWPGAVFSIAPYPLVPPGPLAAPPQLGEEGWDHLRASGEHVTLDLMQTPSSSMEMLSARSRSRDDEEDCCEIWRSLEGTHVV